MTHFVMTSVVKSHAIYTFEGVKTLPLKNHDNKQECDRTRTQNRLLTRTPLH